MSGNEGDPGEKRPTSGLSRRMTMRATQAMIPRSGAFCEISSKRLSFVYFEPELYPNLLQFRPRKDSSEQ